MYNGGREGILYPGVARVEDRKKKRKEKKKPSDGDDLSVNGEWKSECPIRGLTRLVLSRVHLFVNL